MHERLKKLRKTLELTQQEFADRIGSKRSTIAKYEIEDNTPSAAVISLICREFNVNEEWLRNGTGDMFLISRNSDIEKLTNQLLSEESDSFKKHFVSILANLTVDEWEILERKAREIASIFSISNTETLPVEKKYEENSSNFTKNKVFSESDLKNLTIEERVALYRAELEREEKVEGKSEVS